MVMKPTTISSVNVMPRVRMMLRDRRISGPSDREQGLRPVNHPAVGQAGDDNLRLPQIQKRPGGVVALRHVGVYPIVGPRGEVAFLRRIVVIGRVRSRRG